MEARAILRGVRQHLQRHPDHALDCVLVSNEHEKAAAFLRNAPLCGIPLEPRRPRRQ